MPKLVYEKQDINSGGSLIFNAFDALTVTQILTFTPVGATGSASGDGTLTITSITKDPIGGAFQVTNTQSAISITKSSGNTTNTTFTINYTDGSATATFIFTMKSVPFLLMSCPTNINYDGLLCENGGTINIVSQLNNQYPTTSTLYGANGAQINITGVTPNTDWITYKSIRRLGFSEQPKSNPLEQQPTINSNNLVITFYQIDQAVCKLDKNGTVTYTLTSSTIVAFTFNLTITESSCLLKGTMIQTIDGEMPIENIQKDDFLILSNGKKAKVINTTSERFHLTNPIDLYCIEKNTFAPNVPHQDTFLSPRHVFGYKGKLYHPEHLTLKGVYKCTDKDEFELYNLELENYLDGLMIANGLEVETKLIDTKINKDNDLLGVHWDCEYKNRVGVHVHDDCKLILFHSHRNYFKLESWKPFLQEAKTKTWQKITGNKMVMAGLTAMVSVFLLN